LLNFLEHGFSWTRENLTPSATEITRQDRKVISGILGNCKFLA